MTECNAGKKTARIQNPVTVLQLEWKVRNNVRHETSNGTFQSHPLVGWICFFLACRGPQERCNTTRRQQLETVVFAFHFPRTFRTSSHTVWQHRSRKKNSNVAVGRKDLRASNSRQPSNCVRSQQRTHVVVPFCCWKKKMLLLCTKIRCLALHHFPHINRMLCHHSLQCTVFAKYLL